MPTIFRFFSARRYAIIRVIVIVSVLGTINAVVLATARVLLAMGRDGLFAHHATRVNAGGTPTVALLLSTVQAPGSMGRLRALEQANARAPRKTHSDEPTNHSELLRMCCYYPLSCLRQRAPLLGEAPW